MTVTIKAWTIRETPIEWNYDNPQQAAPLWKKLTATGHAPDTGEKLIRAYYWGPARKPGEGPDKAWAP